jgi:hypothetical protein
VFRYANLFSLNGETYTPRHRDCQGKGDAAGEPFEKDYSRNNRAVVDTLHRPTAVDATIRGACRRKFLMSGAGTYGYNPAFAWRKT